ncbi:MAG TPA: DUF2157 domain-containing protein [Dehalococcoidia bacterium]|nr:DUF2157 domain-containing protein [Dehalococcoidia bacterium]
MEEREYRERLARDVAGWRREGLIAEEQERAILGRYGADGARAVSALRLGWFATTVSIVGAIVLAAGVVLLFAANWNTMPSWLRAAAVFGGMAAAYGAGYALMERYRMQRVGSALLLAGALLYQAGLFLLAEIYHLPTDRPIYALLGAAGVLPLAYLFGSRIILLAAIAGFSGWVIGEMAARYPDEPRAASAMLVVAVLGVALYGIGRLHALRAELARFSETYVFSGLLALMGLVYVFTFDEPWAAVRRSGVAAFSAPPVVYASIALAAMIVGAQWALRPRDVESLADAGGQAALLLLAAVVATWPGWTGYAVVFSAVYFSVAAAVVTRGYLRGDELYVNAGLLAVAVGLLTRYVDLFWSVLPGSAFFISGGVLLLAVAFVLERMRRGLLRGMGADGEPAAPGAAGAVV